MVSSNQKKDTKKGNKCPIRLILWGVLLGMVMLYSGCTTLQPVDLSDETALAPAQSDLWTTLTAARPGNWFHSLNTGDEGLEWRLRLIDSATHSLDLQTFLWSEDDTGLKILRHILEAANRGVRVRLLIDDTFTVGENDMIFDLDQHPNIEFRIYNPFGRRYNGIFLRQLMNAGEFSRLDHRMHNKAIVADNHAAILGGRNLADEYFGRHSVFNFRDMEVLAVGPIITSISNRFDANWNSNWSMPVERILDLPPPDKQLADLVARLEEDVDRGLVEHPMTRYGMWLTAARSAVPGEAVVFSDEPAQKHPEEENEFPNQLAQKILEWIEKSNEELIIVSAYLIPTPEVESAIERAEKRGVRVRILTNSLRSNNHTAAHSAYRHHVRRLIEHGAELHEVRAKAKDRSLYMRTPVSEKTLGLHAKLILFDRTHAFVGSANMDARSLHLNTEIGLFIESEELNARLREKLEVDFHKRNAWHLLLNDDGKVVWMADDIVLESQPADSILQRLEDWFLSILPIEEEM